MPNNMQAVMESFSALIAGKSPINNPPDVVEHDELDALVNLYAEDGMLYFQGRNWPFAGKHEGRAAIKKILREVVAVFAEPLVFWDNRFWVLDDERLLWWWRSRSVTFKDKPMSNSGLTILRYRDNLIIEHHEYTDTEYLADMFSGWREQMPGAKDAIPAWPAVTAEGLFPDTGNHDLDRPW